MKQSNDLFELISSMSKSEKRYFVLQSNLHKGNKQYIRLFKALEKLDSYNEKEFRKLNSDKSFVKNLAFCKNHLYKLIMKSLIDFSSGRSADAKIHSLISECKILFRKTLYPRYFRTIEKAKQLALKHERFGYVMQIMEMEKIIVRKEEQSGDKINTLHNEFSETAARMKNVFEYSRIGGLLLSSFRKFGLTRGEFQISAIDEIIDNRLMSSTDKALSNKALEGYFRVKELAAIARGDFESSYQAQLKRLETVKGDPSPFLDQVINYRSDILYSLLETSLQLNRPAEAAQYLKEIREILDNSKDSLDDFEIYRSFVYFRRYLAAGDTQKAGRLIPRLEHVLKKYKNKMLIDTELSILFYIVKCRMMEGKYPAALKAANTLGSHPLLGKRADYESYLKIMNLVIHFELKNFELLRYLLISAYRFLYKREKLFKVEMLVLEFIRKLPKVKNEHDLSFIFSRMQKELTKLKQVKYEKNAFEYFDFSEWINKKITKK
ncbi:MAG: hypothetical protein IAE90_11950 [Ignavibacteria bacterium]|nr:hypothetical protein [Ignavibacteria bacterium]